MLAFDFKTVNVNAKPNFRKANPDSFSMLPANRKLQ